MPQLDQKKSSVPLNNKREDQSIQRLALDLQNSLQHNCSVNKTNTYQTSSSCNLNEQMLQRQFHSEKGTNRVTNETTPNPYCYEDIRHNPLHFDNNQSATAQTVSNTQFSAVPIGENQNSGKLASAMSLPTIAQTNVSQQFQNLHYPTGIHFSNGNQTEEPKDGIVFSPPIELSTTKVPTLFAVHHLSHLVFRLLRKINLQTTKQPFIPHYSTY